MSDSDDPRCFNMPPLFYRISSIGLVSGGCITLFHSIPFSFFLPFFNNYIIFSPFVLFPLGEWRHLPSIKSIPPPLFVRNWSRLSIVHVDCAYYLLSLPIYLYSFLTYCLFPVRSVSGILDLSQSLTDSLSPIPPFPLQLSCKDPSV